MQLNENKFFRMTSRKMESCALYMYANQSTREAIINDIFHKLKYADFDALSKQVTRCLGSKIYITKNEFKEVSGIIKKGCRNYNLSKKFIIETCIILAIKALHKNGSLYISRDEINTKGDNISIYIQNSYTKMLRCKIEPKYDKLPTRELITMAIKYVLKNKYDCVNILQKQVNFTEKDKSFLRELYENNRDILNEFENTLFKLIKFHYKGKDIKSTDFTVFNWIADEFIIKYYKLDRNVFTIGKIIEKEPEPIPEKKNDDKVMTESTIQKDDQLNCKNRVYPNNRTYDNDDLTEEDYERINTEIEEVIEESDYFKSDSSHPVNKTSYYIADSDDFSDDLIMMKILKLRSQLKHTKLELIIKDKE